jgi:hypothetical protein
MALFAQRHQEFVRANDVVSVGEVVGNARTTPAAIAANVTVTSESIFFQPVPGRREVGITVSRHGRAPYLIFIISALRAITRACARLRAREEGGWQGREQEKVNVVWRNAIFFEHFIDFRNVPATP